MQLLFVTMISADDTARKHLVQRFRFKHTDLFPAEVLDRLTAASRCPTRGSVHHSKDSVSHGAERS